MPGHVQATTIVAAEAPATLVATAAAPPPYRRPKRASNAALPLRGEKSEGPRPLGPAKNLTSTRMMKTWHAPKNK